MLQRVSSELRAVLADDARAIRAMRLFAAVFAPLVLLLLFVNLLPGPEPLMNRVGGALGHDFTQIWVAGRAALQGQAASVYDIDTHIARLTALFGPETRFAWHYPPPFFLPAAALALLPYQAALVAWLVLSATLFVMAIRAITPRWDIVLLAMATPLFYRNLGYGQNGLLTASLLTFGVVLLQQRPVLAGVCFGLLCYKPQLGAIVPLALLVAGQWRAIGAAAATVAVVVLASVFAFGTEAWAAFFRSIETTNQIILRDAISGLDLNMSAFGALRLWGGSMVLAWGVQAVVMLVVAVAVVATGRRGKDPRLTGAVLLAGAPLMSPYVPEYDLAVLVPAVILGVTGAAAAGRSIPVGQRFLFVVALTGMMVARDAAIVARVPLGFFIAFAVFASMVALATGWRAGQPAAAEANPAPA